MASNKFFQLDLSNLNSISGSNFKENDTVSVKSGSDGSTYDDDKVVVTVSADTATIGLDGFGSLNAVQESTDNSVVAADFVADAGIAAGSYDVKIGNDKVSLNSFDAKKATKDLTIKLDSATFLADGTKKVATGSGNDTIHITAAGMKVSGGLGADTFVVGSVSGTVEDYSYAQGDVVSVTSIDSNQIGWVGNDLKVGSSNAVTVQTTSANDLFQVLVQNDDSKLLAAKAVVNSDVNVTLDKIAGLVDVTGAKSAVVDLGAKNDIIRGANDAALTLKVGMNDGVNTVSAFDEDDTIKFSSGSWNAVEVDTASNGLKFGNTTLGSVLSAAAGNTFNVQFGDGEAQKVAYTTGTGASVAAYNKDINFYLGKGTANSGISVDAANEEVNLNLITGAKNIANVTVAAAKELNLVAAGNSSISVNATHEGDFVFDLTAVGNSTNDSLNLNNSTGKDIVKLSTAGGQDTITGFTLDDDVLVLDDVSAITKKTFIKSTNDFYLADSLKGAKIEGVLAVDNAGHNVTVQLADGTTEKVAMVADASSQITATEDTSLVLNLGGANKLSLASKAAGQMFDMTNVVNDGVKFVGNSFEEVTIGTANGAAMFIGAEGVSQISVNAGTSENGAAVWAGKDNDATVTLGDGADIVWAGFLDGDVTVSGITKDDAVYTYGENLDAKAVAGKLSYNDTNHLVFASSDSTKMDLGAANGTAFKVAGNAGSLYNVVGMNSSNVVSYSEDADILVGDDATLNVMVEKTVGIDLSGTMGLDSKVYSGINSIDASRSTSNSCLVLANSAGGQITASAGGSAMWGGGNESQTLIGGYGADIFWFGSADGADFARNVSKDDCVFLYNATDISEVEIGGTNNKQQLIFTATGSTLTFGAGCVDVTQMTFSINDLENPGSFKNYSYDATSKTFVEKK